MNGPVSAAPCPPNGPEEATVLLLGQRGKGMEFLAMRQVLRSSVLPYRCGNR